MITAIIGTTASNVVMAAPTGVKSKILIHASVHLAAAQARVYISDPDVSDALPHQTNAPTYSVTNDTANVYGGSQVEVMTNTSAQIRRRSDSADTTVNLVTIGYTERRM